MNKKIGVFLTGGGGKGSFQIGFFKALEEMEIKPDIICGSSVGALVGGAATYLKSDEMLECWKTLTLESVLNVDSNKITKFTGSKRTLKLWKETFISCIKPKILIDTNKLRTLLYNVLDGDKIMTSTIDFGITTTQLPNFKLIKKFKEEMKSDNILEHILSSLYLPIFRPQKIINNKHYIDIADIRRYPLEMLKEKECTEIFIVDVTSGGEKKMQKSIQHTKFNKNTDITIINMPYKASLLDFSEEQALINYESGYEVTKNTIKIFQKSN